MPTRGSAGTRGRPARRTTPRPTRRRSRSAERPQAERGRTAGGCCATLRTGRQLGFGSRTSDPRTDASGPERRAVGPIRTCVGCRAKSAADGLLRVVVVHGVLTPDPRRRLPGRGAWLHPVPECLDRAERRSAFPRALRVPGPLEIAVVRSHLSFSAAATATGSIASGIRETPGSVTPGSRVDPS